jgi:hypothetical protein
MPPLIYSENFTQKQQEKPIELTTAVFPLARLAGLESEKIKRDLLLVLRYLLYALVGSSISCATL